MDVLIAHIGGNVTVLDAKRRTVCARCVRPADSGVFNALCFDNSWCLAADRFIAAAGR
jgi:hypothetical protein